MPSIGLWFLIMFIVACNLGEIAVKHNSDYYSCEQQHGQCKLIAVPVEESK